MEERTVGRGQRASMVLGALAAVAVTFMIAYPVAFQDQIKVAASTPVVSAPAEDALSRLRNDREKTRALEIEQLNRVADDENASAEVRGEARQRLVALTEHMEDEVTLEGVLRARGFQDVVATVHPDSVNVLVRADSLTRADTAVILELAMRETGQSGGNIKIIPV